MENTKSSTERLRPEVALGASDEDLSVPQHELNNDATAEQKQKPALVAMQVTREAYLKVC
jgi:hypothetical protein